MVIIDWDVNDLPPPVFEDVGMNVYVDVDVTSTPTTEVERERGYSVYHQPSRLEFEFELQQIFLV